MLRRLSALPGWHRFADKVIPHDRQATFLVKNRGIRFEGNLVSHIDRQIYLFGGYEEQHIARLLDLIPAHRRDTALDVGANVGTHALRFAQYFREVHAFEPNPDMYRQLERNIALNDLAVRAHQVGLADRDEVLDFHLTERPNAGLGTFSKVEQYDVALKVVGRARVVMADGYLKDKIVGRVDAVKIGTQGFEPEVLRGMSALLRQHRPYIWFEVGGATMGQVGGMTALEKVIPFPFRLLKFETIKGLRRKVVLTVSNGAVGRGNYVAVPLA